MNIPRIELGIFVFQKIAYNAKNQSVNATQDFERILEDGAIKYK